MNRILSLIIVLSAIAIIVPVVYWILTWVRRKHAIEEINDLLVRMNAGQIEEGESLQEYLWILEEMRLYDIPKSALRFSLDEARNSAFESFTRVLDNHNANLERVQKELSDPKLDDTDGGAAYKQYLEQDKTRLELLVKQMSKELEEFLEH